MGVYIRSRVSGLGDCISGNPLKLAEGESPMTIDSPVNQSTLK